MTSKLEHTIWSCDTGQRMPCFDSCHLTMKWNFDMTVNQGERTIGLQASNGRHDVRLRTLTQCAHEQLALTTMTTMKRTCMGFLFL